MTEISASGQFLLLIALTANGPKVVAASKFGMPLAALKLASAIFRISLSLSLTLADSAHCKNYE